MFLAIGAKNICDEGRTKMPRARNQQTDYNGFAIPLQPNTDLGNAMLIAEDDDGHYIPICVVATISEAKETADADFRGRTRRLERGEDAGICPVVYRLWARGVDGGYCLATEIRP
jgi:hypothetical protein